ncbi:MAG: putative rane protein [Dehalococcoidia bacterium]|nr:putative rane protein [Dehalococcoidia bacterium]
MSLPLIFILAFSPGLFWLWLIYTRDKYRPEPRALVIRTFLLGIAVSLPVVGIEYLLSYLYPGLSDLSRLEDITDINTVVYVSFVVAGLTEEVAKYWVVRYTIYNSPYFDEPIDGIIYGSAAALGFASIENVGYALVLGWQFILARGIFSCLGHVFFSGVWGYSLGWQKLKGSGSYWVVWLALLGSIVLHGAFDFFLLANRGLEVFTILLFFISGGFFLFLVRLAIKKSPYRDKVGTPLVGCLSCGYKNVFYANFCTRCGTILQTVQKDTSIFCSVCDAQVQHSFDFCTSCGSRLDRKSLKKPL